MRHESSSRSHNSRQGKYLDDSSDENALPYTRESELVGQDDEYRHRKRKKHKRHRHYPNDEKVEYYHSRTKHHRYVTDITEDEVVEVHGSSSDEEIYKRKENEHKSSHRRKHKHEEYYSERRYCTNHKKRRKAKSDSSEASSVEEEEEEENSESDKSSEHHSPKVKIKEEVPDSDFDNYNSHHKERKKKKNHRVEVKQEPADETVVKREPDDVQHRNVQNNNRDGNERSRREQNEQGASTGRVRKSRFNPVPGEEEWGRGTKPNQVAPGDKQKPNFELSGKLAEDTNMYNGVVIKYSEPPEARKPKRRWRLYPFKGDQSLPPLYIHRQSAYLLGRDRKVVDIPIDHPSCSKQHAALQYRLVPFERANGTVGKQIRLYIIDLESANGTFINNKEIEKRKYVELRERDVIKFGFSSREYVLLHEHSKDDDDDDVKPPPLADDIEI